MMQPEHTRRDSPQRGEQTTAQAVADAVAQLLGEAARAALADAPEAVKEPFAAYQAATGEALAKQLLQGTPFSAAPTCQMTAAQRKTMTLVGETLGAIIGHLTRGGTDPERALRTDLPAFTHALLGEISRIKNRVALAHNQAVTTAIAEGELAAFLCQEFELEKIASSAALLTFHATVKSGAQAGACILREDFRQAIAEQRGAGADVSYFVSGFWANDPHSLDAELSSAVRALADRGKLRAGSIVDAKNSSEFEGVFEEAPPAALAAHRLVLVPITYGEVFMGNLLVIFPETQQWALSGETKKNLLLTADATGKALAHLRRVEEASPDIGGRHLGEE